MANKNSYSAIQALHTTLPAFSPYISVDALPTLAFVSLGLTFALGFYFSTLPKSLIPAREAAVAFLASLLGGFGVVALFCTVGVYV